MDSSSTETPWNISDETWVLPSVRSSVLPPSMIAAHTIEKGRHGLIRTPDLHLKESGLVAIAVLRWTLRRDFLSIIPGARTANDILLLLALEFSP